MEDEDEEVGGWCYPVLIGATQARYTQSLKRRSLCRVCAPLRYVGFADFETQWNLSSEKEGEMWSAAAAAVVLITQRPVCVCTSSMPSPRRQAEGPCDATHSRVQCMAGLALDPAERVG